MSKEIILGIFGGLLAVATVATIGSFVGQGLSHGPEHVDQAAVPQRPPEPVNPTDTKSGAEVQNTPEGPALEGLENDGKANAPNKPLPNDGTSVPNEAAPEGGAN